MKRLDRWLLMLEIAACGLAPGHPLVAAPKPDARTAITVHVSNYAGVDGNELAEAERVAGSVFRKAGAAVEWVDANEGPEARNSGWQVETALGLSQIRLHIQSASMAVSLGLSNEVMGLAPGSGPDRQLVYVFYDRVKELAQRQVEAQIKGDMVARAAGCRILGEMIAHEIGHILLNLPTHSEIGIMRGAWNLGDLQDVAFGDLFFTKQQAKLIRAEVIRRSSIDLLRQSPGLGLRMVNEGQYRPVLIF